MVVALSGLTMLQVKFLGNALDIKEQAFHGNVMAALGKVSQRMTTREMVSLAFADDSLDLSDSDAALVTVHLGTSYANDSAGMRTLMLTADSCAPSMPLRVEDGQVAYCVASPQHVKLQVYDAVIGTQTTLVDTFLTDGEYSVDIDQALYSEGNFVWKLATDSVSIAVEVTDGSQSGFVPGTMADSGRQMLVKSIVQDLVSGTAEPLEERVDSTVLDSIIALSMRESGIDLDYAYGVFVSGDDSMRLGNATEHLQNLRDSRYRTRLFPHDIFAESAILALHFPRAQIFLWQQVVPLL
ncbi:MAG: hypothetical protein DRP45_11630, partial [Candidatus Zixiibacteriota bacterium]